MLHLQCLPQTRPAEHVRARRAVQLRGRVACHADGAVVSHYYVRVGEKRNREMISSRSVFFFYPSIDGHADWLIFEALNRLEPA